jgi:predicted restriction endonuclease
MACGWDEAPVDLCHITPRAAGGSNNEENLLLLCPNHHRLLDLGLLDPTEVR